jgi:2-polyprenyl-3-methyl-5-hydroxy-6-metoxy-1,4-benzoquinol methylase
MRQLGAKQGNHLVRCGCGFVSVDLNRWQYPFRDRDYYEAADLDSPESAPAFAAHRAQTLKKHLKGGIVADLGSGAGHTVLALAKAGYDTIGVEESRTAIELLKASCPHIDWRNCGILDYLREPRIHDGITLYHVLEHIPDPGQVCRLVRERLRSGGVLVVEVPDLSSGQARIQGERWGMYIPEHVNYFTPATLQSLLEPMGFRLVYRERKYHFAWPAGVWWRDMAHQALSAIGMHSIITTYWRV